MKQYLLTVILYACIPLGAIGQKEAWNWYFGNYAGITFKNGSPTSLTDGTLSTWEGVATISDSSGKLLFYTDGRYVYNSLNQVMPNGKGLYGNSSSTQSAIIIKKPGSQSLYYIFTVDAYEDFPGKGLNYSVVDMSLNGGLGDVVTKNVLLRNKVIEKLTVARHRNNHDFWILINDWDDDDIYAYDFSCSGINTEPVKSNIGPFHNHNIRNMFGYLKASRNNDKLALAITSNNSFSIMDFDNNTGIASNRKDLVGTGSTFGGPYGVEFSPDGNFLYGSTISNPKLFQFNLNAGSGDDIYNSRVLLATHGTIYTFNNYYYGALQLGPDGKIYSANNGDYSLGVINDPNMSGLSCNYTNNVVSLNSRQCLLGLPNIFADYAFPPPRDTVYAAICEKDAYTLPDASQVNSAGIYLTHLSSATVCDSLIVTKLVVNPVKAVTVFDTLCEGYSYQLPDGRYVTQAGIYKDTLQTTLGCDSIVVTTLFVKPKSLISIDSMICEGSSVFGYTITGTYIDTLQAANGCDSIRILRLSVKQKSFFTIDTTICNSQTYLGHGISGTYIDTMQAANGCDSIRTLHLTVSVGLTSKISQTICEGSSFLGYTANGTYIDTLKAVYGCDTIRSLYLTVLPLPNPSLGPNQQLCTGSSLTLYPGMFDAYLWQDGSRQSHFTVNTAGLYTVAVTNGCGTKEAKIIISEKPCDISFPKAFTPNGDGLNDVFRILNANNIEKYQLTIYNRLGQKIFQTYNYATGWDGTFKGQAQDRGTYVWVCNFTRNNIRETLSGTVVMMR